MKYEIDQNQLSTYSQVTTGQFRCAAMNRDLMGLTVDPSFLFVVDCLFSIPMSFSDATTIQLCTGVFSSERRSASDATIMCPKSFSL